MTPRQHRDSHELDDWATYGPKDAEISRLVSCLALEHALQVREIEDLILQALKDRLVLEETRPKS